MSQKVFYREITKEYINNAGLPNEVQYGKIQYGSLPTESRFWETTSYDDLIEQIRFARQRKIRLMNDLSICKRFGKNVIYSSSKGWVEEGQFGAGIISRKHFKKYSIETTFEIYTPTLKQLIENVPLPAVEEYIKDHPDLKALLNKKY